MMQSLASAHSDLFVLHDQALSAPSSSSRRHAETTYLTSYHPKYALLLVHGDSHELSKQCGMDKLIILKAIIVDSRNIAEPVLAVIFASPSAEALIIGRKGDVHTERYHQLDHQRPAQERRRQCHRQHVYDAQDVRMQQKQLHSQHLLQHLRLPRRQTLSLQQPTISGISNSNGCSSIWCVPKTYRVIQALNAATAPHQARHPRRFQIGSRSASRSTTS